MFKKDQKVWCAIYGAGVVKRIRQNEAVDYPVIVVFNRNDDEIVISYTADGRFHKQGNVTLFPYPVEVIKALTKPSVNWEHVDSKFNYLAEDANGDAFLYEKEPSVTETTFGSRGGEIAEVRMFASYVKGICDWKESLVKRPEGDSHDG